MKSALDRIIPVLCVAVIIWPFAIIPFAFVLALIASLFGFAVVPAIAAYGAIPLAIYWASRIWSV